MICHGYRDRNKARWNGNENENGYVFTNIRSCGSLCERKRNCQLAGFRVCLVKWQSVVSYGISIWSTGHYVAALQRRHGIYKLFTTIVSSSIVLPLIRACFSLFLSFFFSSLFVTQLLKYVFPICRYLFVKGHFISLCRQERKFSLILDTRKRSFFFS